jgi:hypothetical protein
MQMKIKEQQKQKEEEEEEGGGIHKRGGKGRPQPSDAYSSSPTAAAPRGGSNPYSPSAAAAAAAPYNQQFHSREPPPTHSQYQDQYRQGHQSHYQPPPEYAISSQQNRDGPYAQSPPPQKYVDVRNNVNNVDSPSRRYADEGARGAAPYPSQPQGYDADYPPSDVSAGAYRGYNPPGGGQGSAEKVSPTKARVRLVQDVYGASSSSLIGHDPTPVIDPSWRPSGKNMVDERQKKAMAEHRRCSLFLKYTVVCPIVVHCRGLCVHMRCLRVCVYKCVCPRETFVMNSILFAI